MKFKVHIYDITRNKLRNAKIGRFEIYDEDGEFVEGTTKRRIRNYNPEEAESVPLIIIHNKAGLDKKLSVQKVNTTLASQNTTTWSAHNNPYRDILDSEESTPTEAIYEVTCVEAN